MINDIWLLYFVSEVQNECFTIELKTFAELLLTIHALLSAMPYTGHEVLLINVQISGFVVEILLLILAIDI